MTSAKDAPDNWERKNVKNTAKLLYWNIAWVVSLAIAVFGPKLIWEFATLPTVAGLLFNLGIGFGMIMANKRYLQGLDEMQQKIFLEASAITLGVGLVCGVNYELLEDVKLIPFQPEISHLVMLMSFTFMVALINGRRRYQ